MEEAWKPDPVARFWQRLIRERAVEFMRDPKWMKPLRYDNDEAMRLQKRFGAVWEEFGTDIYKLIAEAHNEKWDVEDEEKHAPVLAKVEYAAVPLWVKKESTVNQRNDDDLAPARQASPRKRLDELQGKPEEGERVLEKEERISLSLGGSTEEETPRPQEKGGKRGGRREDFYRRAGGT